MNGRGVHAAVVLPVHIALQFKADAIHFDENVLAGTNNDVVAIEYLTHALKVVLAFRQVIVSVISDQKRFKFEHFDGIVNLVIAVFSPAHRDEDIVIAR